MSGFLHESLWFLGALLIAGIALWLLLTLVRGLLNLIEDARRLRHERVLFRQRLKTARNAARRAESARGWADWRKFEVLDKRLEDEAGSMCRLTLKPHDDEPIADYQPGQFITLRVNPPGCSKPLVRCYSLSTAPHPDAYRITVKRVGAAAPGVPPGVCSGFLHDRVQVGDLIDLKAPGGQFFVDLTSHRALVLIGGGSGITPLLSIAEAVVEAGQEREVWLFYGISEPDQVIRREVLERWAAEQRVKVHVCVSDGSPPEDEALNWHAGLVKIERLTALLPSSNYEYFICGPGRMMLDLADGLTAWGVPGKRIHTEKFGPGAQRKRKQLTNPAATGPEVIFRKSGKRLRWDPAMEHLWEFAYGADVEIDSGCLEGDCGTCLTGIISGEVAYTKKPGFEVPAGTCLPCCCVPRGRLEIDA